MIVFNNVNLMPMTGEKVIDNQTVLVDDTEIIEISPVNEVVIPEKTKIIDGEGEYLMPGLADMHVHMLRDKWAVSSHRHRHCECIKGGCCDEWKR